MKTKENALLELFENNDELFNATIEELDSYNGYLGDVRYYDMDMLVEFYSGADPIELLNRAFFGRDDDSWHTDQHSNKIYSSFNPNREYFTFNGYGNLVSTDYKDYSALLDEWFIDSLIENQSHLYLDGEITAILEEGENDE